MPNTDLPGSDPIMADIKHSRTFCCFWAGIYLFIVLAMTSSIQALAASETESPVVRSLGEMRDDAIRIVQVLSRDKDP
ncbi:MAG: hypothetical protein D6698_11110, partial [Gammaproteobacteria bacterium]